jgi:hypothetical protein
MPAHATTGLTVRQVDEFIEHGAVRLDHGFGKDIAAACRAALWARIGLSPDAPETWTAPVIRVDVMVSEPFVAAANTPALHRAYDQLAGAGRWIAPRGLGSIPVRFPSAVPPGDDGWHVDMSFGSGADYLDWRVNVTSRGRALLMLFLFSDVSETDAPTRIRLGSHAQIARELLPRGPEGATLWDLAEEGWRSTADCPEALATGEAGSVWLCHPFLVHAAQAHRGQEPRFMAQPPLLPRGDFDPALRPSPVQIAIRRACGLPL